MLIKGFLLGLALSAPIGVIGLWAIQRSINHGWFYGFMTGLGAVIADLVFALIAALGFTALIAPYVKNNPWPSLIGALMVIYLGISSIRQSTNKDNQNSELKPKASRYFMGSFILIMTHPAAILVFLAIFTGLDIQLNGEQSVIEVSQLLIGLTLGGCSWWLFLSTLASYLGRKMTPSLMHKFNLCSGIMVIGFGLWLGWNAFS